MKGKRKNSATCPCCKQVRHYTEIQIATRAYKNLIKKDLIHYYEKDISKNIATTFDQEEFEWACDLCLQQKRAVTANPELQTFVDWQPYFAYFDSERTCERCNEFFLFSKDEKRFWYEELKFWVQSKPKHCKACRKKVRQEKADHKKLSTLMPIFDQLSTSDTEQIIEIYLRMGQEEKAKYYQAIAKKRNRRS